MKNKPKYEQIISYFRERIGSGDLPSGMQLMTEIEICKKFNTTRQTANKALQILANEGIIVRKRGKGTFVQDKFVRKNVRSHSSFTEDMRQLGLVAGSKTLEYKIILAEEEPIVAKALNLSPDEQMHYFVRLRTGSGKPIALSYTYLPAKLFPDFNLACLNGSLHEYFKKSGIVHGRALCQMSAWLPTDKQRALLEIGDDVALLRNHHLTLDIHDTPYEYIDTYYRGECYSYCFEAVQTKHDPLK